jgi:hypothetical protein
VAALSGCSSGPSLGASWSCVSLQREEDTKLTSH